MQLVCTIDNKYIDKFMAILLSGILHSLKEGSITIDESELLVFRPFISRLLHKNSCDKELIDIIDLGCEFEDIESLVPEHLDDAIKNLITKVSDFTYAKKDNYPLSDEIENAVSFMFRN
ncbi:DUF3969 family protein [Escherichia coli]|uniref:DUF3969 family protein n=1 Tax=Escherichia coli TaxID=562 RepID=UPI000E03FA25|nr:DUF3969 family protein [Escherichia coli]EHK0832760.1 DUF3969 family protein [Escherichia coli]ELA4751269.1 DUF3969 family protein [Escherichia coli]MCF3446412.1 DUF3969 family protein [Escherichia coli]MDA6500161.1 DUF3969 family protein [Escherichia coli]MDC3537864.1 DUF3969 family protein [Escherichia coli]